MNTVDYAQLDDKPKTESPMASAPTYGVVTPNGAAPLGDAPQNDITIGSWGAGLWGCFDSCMPNCCMSWLCPCVTLAQVAHRVRWMKYSTALVLFCLLTVLSNGRYAVHEYTTYSTFGWWMSAIGSVVYVIKVIMVMSLRGSVRKQFHIPGDACGDCCCSFWCLCCVAAQMATHVKSYKPGGCSFAAPEQLAADQLPGYQA